jgi:hypothetical protein
MIKDSKFSYTISLVQIVQYLRAELMLHKCLDLTCFELKFQMGL